MESLSSLAEKVLSKYRVELFNLKQNESYCIVERKTGLVYPVGKLLECKNMSVMKNACWYDGPIYESQKHRLVFDNAEKELSKKLESVELYEFYREYIGIFHA